MSFVASISQRWQLFAIWLDRLRPIADLVARLYVARVFLLSGLSKAQDWEATLYLFREEYHVPLLPPELAAACATAGELGLSVLLAVGLFTRFSALGLFVLNAVAVISYYDALVSTPAGLHDHMEWGIILALLFTAQTGLLSLDRLLLPRLHARR
jgi:putative oxidoreductase